MNDYIQHHGILGMKWGVRRYQNADGTLTAAGKKRYAKELQKATSKDELRETLSSNSKFIKSDDIKALKEADKNLSKAYELEDEFIDSKALKDARKEAYDDTILYYKKNDPSYLNDIIKQNSGKTTDLDKFRDFRKTYEGFEDINWDEAYDAFCEKKGIDRNYVHNAVNAVVDVQQRITESLVGKYGKTKLKNLPINRFGEYSNLETTITNLLPSIIADMDRRKIQ